MAIVRLVAAAKNQSAFGTLESDAFDGTDVNFIAVWAGINAAPITLVEDSEENEYTELTPFGDTLFGTWWVCFNPVVSASMTVTITGGGFLFTLGILAYSGVTSSSPLDDETGAFNNATTTLAPGSQTPAEDNEVFLVGLMANATTTFAIDSGFTVRASIAGNNVNTWGCAVADLIQITGSAKNPAYTVDSSMLMTVAMISVKAAAAATGKPTVYLAQMRQQ